ncbi:peptidylprolyl isomerase [Jiangella rhizosphaerae]|uniref:Peptidyl-prolyl cis-trans isomerase n=1 Tax=Jiangella rhizosphaerae TaxID=2293569 RepID=A0A418KLD4_9ACTN|nr:peptidylprolyl isomerase [Jiangella rhizosphaerae]RIQ18355.1 peptidylprolyl isomerase [Jiangella rhizosphaerae]
MAQSAKQRRRQLARQHYERQQARRAEQAQKRRKIGIVVGAVIVAVALVMGTLLVSGALGDDDDPVASGTDSSPSADAAAGTCDYRAAGESAVPDLGTPPAIDPAALQTPLPTTATLTINGAPVTVTLDAGAPCTVNSLAFLASAGYYDGTACHRLTTSDSLKVLQCGDPTGTGSGGPGYEYDNENTDGATYPAGTVAMANSGPNTNGSQFFLVYGDSQLPPDYTVFGQITTGLDVITGIAEAGTDNGSEDGAPITPVTLDSVTTA